MLVPGAQQSDSIFLSLFIWLLQVLVVAGRLLSCGMHVGSSSLTSNRTQAPCIGSAESYPLRHQGSPLIPYFLCITK